MALPTKSTAAGSTPTTVVYQPLGGGRRRIVLIAIATTVALLVLALTQSLVTTTPDTRGDPAGQPIVNASAVTPFQVPTEPTQPLGVPLGPSESLLCGLACTDEMAALWRARTEPNADVEAIARAFRETVRTTLDTIGQAVVDAARSIP
jgi:hypothetical protein